MDPKSPQPWRNRLHEIIYEADTPKGKVFDVVLLFILLSVVLVALESVPSINSSYKDFFHWAEWCITILFSVEYLLRIIAVSHSATSLVFMASLTCCLHYQNM